MAGGRERADAYHQQFAERIIQALKDGTAPWQNPWKSGERTMPHNFRSGRDHRGGNAEYLAMLGLDRGYVDPRWGGYRQIQEAGGHVRKGEKGTPIMYVDFRQRRTAGDEQGQPIRDEEGRPKLEWVQRDRPLVKLHYVFNVEQTEGLKLRSLETAAPECDGHERAVALINASGVRVDHVAGDRAYYSLKDDRVVLPDRSRFESQSAYTHTALHELGHATGNPDRLNRPTLVDHEGFGSKAYAREELRAEIAAMMTGEQLGVGHEVRHGIKALENDPKEIRAAAADAQRISDRLMARERERSVGDDMPIPCGCHGELLTSATRRTSSLTWSRREWSVRSTASTQRLPRGSGRPDRAGECSPLKWVKRSGRPTQDGPSVYPGRTNARGSMFLGSTPKEILTGGQARRSPNAVIP